MVNVTIDNKKLSVPKGTTILNAAKEAGITIPTLCYLPNVHEIGACRVCVVEVEGTDKLVSSCNTECQEGMVINTCTPKVKSARRLNVDLLLSQHKTNCPSCERSGNCQLQKVSRDTGAVNEMDFSIKYQEKEWPEDFPLIRDESKCIRCYRCVSVCEKVQTCGVWDMVGTGSRTSVGVSKMRDIKDSPCVICGQCITHCPTNALRSRNDIPEITGLKGVINDPNKVTVVQIAPAVRAAFGESFGLGPDIATEKRMAAAARKIGFDYVFDTNFSADLTIMEEGTEFLEHVKNPDKYSWPMFTSCCPGWMRFLKANYPEFVKNASTAKSPQQMFGAITKTYFAKKINKNPADIVCISIMPCSCKKMELSYDCIDDANPGLKDVDYSLTVREFTEIIRQTGIDISKLDEEEFDSPLGTGSGAGCIFGATGGVMEAALRTCYYVMTGQNPNADETFKKVRAAGSNEPWVEAEYDVNGTKVRTAVVNGLGNTRKLLESIKRGESEFEFVEVMACPGGCVGGGGQPIHYNDEKAEYRAKYLYDLDSANTLRFSHENPDVQTLYKDFLEEPCSHLAHELLHTDHDEWNMPTWQSKY